MTDSVFKASAASFQNLKSFYYYPVLPVSGYDGALKIFLVLISKAMSA